MMSKEQTNNSELPTAYIKFFEQFPQIDTLDVLQWKTPHILAYIAKRYKSYYGIDFTFRMNSSAPSKAYECVQIAKLKQMISSDVEVLKQYIDWVFDKKIIERKKRITTLAIFIDIANINFYKWNVLVKKQTDRTTPIPKHILDYIHNYDNTINTYGDLAFVKVANDEKYSKMFDGLKQISFDISILDKIK